MISAPRAMINVKGYNNEMNDKSADALDCSSQPHRNRYTINRWMITALGADKEIKKNGVDYLGPKRADEHQ